MSNVNILRYVGKAKIAMLVATAVAFVVYIFGVFPNSPSSGILAILWIYSLAIVASAHEILKLKNGYNKYYSSFLILMWVLSIAFYTLLFINGIAI